MADLVICGFPQSTYVRTVRMTCQEKGVPYRLEPVEMHQPSHYALHPWGRMPILRHGELLLIETPAICRYIDRVFPGPRLVPADPVGEARMEQWLSACIDYIYRPAVREVIVRRLGFVPEDAAALAAGAAATERSFAIVESTLGRSPWLAGDSLSLADLMLVPIVDWYRQMPEGEAIRGRFRALERWHAALAARPSFQATIPAMPGS